MQADGLLCNADYRTRVLAPGRLLIRNICMVFDGYLRDESRPECCSKAVQRPFAGPGAGNLQGIEKPST